MKNKNVLFECNILINSFSIQNKNQSIKNKGYKYYSEHIKPREPIERSKWVRLYKDFNKYNHI